MNPHPVYDLITTMAVVFIVGNAVGLIGCGIFLAVLWWLP